MFIMLTIISFIVIHISNDNTEVGSLCKAFGRLVFLFSFIGTLLCGCIVSVENSIDEKIAMYIWENKNTSNDLIQAQNSKQINKLKEKKIEISGAKWWLYFGK